MTENQVDGGSDNGTVTDANGNASGNQGVQQPSLDAAKLQEVLDAVGTLSKRVDGLQSVKDKQANELTGLKSQIAEYEKLKERYGSSEQALEQIELQGALRDIQSKLSEFGKVPAQPVGNGASEAVDAAKLFGEMGLDEKDPLVNTILAGLKGKDKDAVELAGYRLREKLSSTPSPTQAQGAAIQGKPPAPGSVEEKTNQYKIDMLANKGNPTKLREIKNKALQEGVPVHNISF